MEPETRPPRPFSLLFPCLPKKEKTNKTMLLDRGCLLWAWDYLDALPLCSCQGWSSSLQGPGRGWVGPVGLCCFPLLYPSTPTNLSLVGIYAQLQTSRAS